MVYQLPQDDPISAFWMDEAGRRLILAGRDRLFFYQEPERLTAVPAGPVLTGLQPHDADFLAAPTGFVVPIGGSGITRRDLQLPGAPRHYRLGIHQGLDFYWQPGTPVRAAADGVVIRANLDYVSPTQAQFNAWRAGVQELGYTSDEALDIYRGQQVWVQHENGLMTRYVHLSSIAPGIAEGAAVTQGQLLGAVGNSGSPLSLESETADAHLHFEIWQGDYYVGQFLRPIETREWVEMTFLGMGAEK
jgi:murein DD-endopeptidase MepM/ murein hydrolase activator NlpD